jgi:tRNA U34 5-methylaminomethyl-2-thiouridine-forming methyltransferase MnmC
MNTPPKNHMWLETLDGSRTLFSENFQEACHSLAGARDETLLHYIKGCSVEEKILKKNLTILEVGFGLGLGFLTTLETLEKLPNGFHFLSLEIDRNLVDWVMNEFEQKKIIWNLKRHDLNSNVIIEASFLKGILTVIVGDARETLPELLKQQDILIDAIYQDAFSPKKNPTLWTVEWFELLKKYSDPDVRLSTYSSSDSIRKSMVEAGWKLQPGEKFGSKRSSTRATLSDVSDPKILLNLDRSPTPAFTDKNIEKK